MLKNSNISKTGTAKEKQTSNLKSVRKIHVSSNIKLTKKYKKVTIS